jgi:hypothetical protein
MSEPKYLLELLSYKNQKRKLNIERIQPFWREYVAEASVLTPEEREDVLKEIIHTALNGMLKEEEDNFIITPEKDILIDMKLFKGLTIIDTIMGDIKDTCFTPTEQSKEETLKDYEKLFHRITNNSDMDAHFINVTGLEDSDVVHSIFALTSYTNQVFYVGNIIRRYT